MKKGVIARVGYRTHVQWVDSSNEYGWQPNPEAQLGQVITVGILVAANDESIAISSSVSTAGHANTVLSIPWCAVEKFKQFEKIV